MTLGTHFPIDDTTVFDLKVTKDGDTYYGKIVFGEKALATAGDETSLIKLPVTVIMQPDAGNVNYFR